MIAQLVVLDVAAGTRSDSQSGLQVLAPKIFGRLADEGCGKDVAFVVIHPSSNFLGHYLIEPLQRRGRAILALNTRFMANDTTLTMERAIQDLGAGIRFLRAQGYRRIVLLGNSGGGSLAAFYQSEAEQLSITTTPDGQPFALTPADLPPVDAIALLAAHPGRAHTFTDWMDAAVLDEADPGPTDPALDMFNPANGPPYDSAWLVRYRAAQAARNDRITDWALAQLRALEADPDPEHAKDAPFIIHRTAADPRFMDLTIDPSDRAAGAARGTARASNAAAIGLGRLCTLRSFLSQWSRRLTRAYGPDCIARTSVPVLAVQYSADSIVFTSQFQEWLDALGPRATPHVVKGATHHMHGQPALVEALADTLVEWAG